MRPSRRNVLVGAGGLTILGGCGSTTSLGRNNANHPNLFDFMKPEDNLSGLVKVMGDLNGSATWLSAQGRIFAIRDGEMPMPILAVEGVRRMKFTKNDAGYEMMTRDWAFYKDLDTGALITQFQNPFTGKTNEVSPILTRPFAWDMTPDRGQQMPEYSGEAYLIDRPLILPWTQEGNDVSLSLELLVKYASGVGGGEWEHFLTSADELNDPTLTSVSMRQAWTGHSPWMRWMNMGDIPGRTLWQSTGRKHASATDLRPEFIRSVNAVFPGSLESPEDYQKPKSI
ncbi:MAG: DUF1838 family protein [Pseudomonadota bacterium]